MDFTPIIDAVAQHLTWDQVVILFTGFPAVLFTQWKTLGMERWAPVLGLLGQPAWFSAAWGADQFGIWLICWAYTFAWAKGFHVHWLSRRIDCKSSRDGAHHEKTRAPGH